MITSMPISVSTDCTLSDRRSWRFVKPSVRRIASSWRRARAAKYIAAVKPTTTPDPTSAATRTGTDRIESLLTISGGRTGSINGRGWS